MSVLVVISFIIAFLLWLYEIRNESEEDKEKKHGCLITACTNRCKT